MDLLLQKLGGSILIGMLHRFGFHLDCEKSLLYFFALSTEDGDYCCGEK